MAAVIGALIAQAIVGIIGGIVAPEASSLTVLQTMLMAGAFGGILGIGLTL